MTAIDCRIIYDNPYLIIINYSNFKRKIVLIFVIKLLRLNVFGVNKFALALLT